MIALSIAMQDAIGNSYSTSFAQITSIHVGYAGDLNYFTLKVWKDKASFDAKKQAFATTNVQTTITESSDLRTALYTWLKTQHAVKICGQTINFTTATDINS